jgi:protein-S-isoprenylcysteine O-methyltransferase Ste14
MEERAMNERADEVAAEREPPIEDADEATGSKELALKGGIVVALLVAGVSVFVAFRAVTDAISTWLQPRWVPIWRAVFALVVAALALSVVLRLADVDWA